MEIKVNQQVVYKKKMLHGNLSVIKIGQVLGFADPDKTVALVSFPVDRVRREVPVSQLEPVQGAYGRAAVQINPSQRGIAFLR